MCVYIYTYKCIYNGGCGEKKRMMRGTRSTRGRRHTQGELPCSDNCHKESTQKNLPTWDQVIFVFWSVRNKRKRERERKREKERDIDIPNQNLTSIFLK